MAGADWFDIEFETIDGVGQTMAVYRGQTLLIVNVASRCGYTPQYAGLEALYRKFQDRGFAVLGFPCDQFGHQEPGTESEIRDFCQQRYGITFPMFRKIQVKGPEAHPLFKRLTTARPGLLGSRSIKWNFTKFLVSGAGDVLRRYGPRTTPEAIGRDIEALVARG